MSDSSICTVLIVEDEPVQRLMLIDFAEAAGFETAEALSAEDSVRILEERPDIRIVVTDIDMPGGVNGLKLAATIRNRWPPIELIIISGRHNPAVAELPKRAIFFSKPYRRDLMVEALHRFAA